MGRGRAISVWLLRSTRDRDRVSLVPRTATYPLFDQITGGNLDGILDAYANDGLGSRQIARKLGEDHNITVSYRTVARWMAAR